MDVERGKYATSSSTYDEEHNDTGAEHEALLPTSNPNLHKPEVSVDDVHNPSKPSTKRFYSQHKFSFLHLIAAFLIGIFGCAIAQYAVCGPSCFGLKESSSSSSGPGSSGAEEVVLAEPGAGSTQIHAFPPTSPTNAFPSMFPTNVGYPGGTPTGAEPALIATAPQYPIHTGAAQLVKPSRLGGTKSGKGKGDKQDWDLFKHWGNLSPWYSNERGTFGLDSNPETPDTCRVTGLHFLHRHGARYPTAWASFGGPADFAGRLNKVADEWNAKGDLAFMNDWTYKLGEEVLTPFGRQQLYDLGISMRLKYGFLLRNFTETNTIPVFRTESQDRMLHSALNFAIGFFGYPFEGQYQQSITIEADGFNNTLAPYDTCHNARYRPISDRGTWYVEQWANIYLNDTRDRFQSQLKGFELSIEDVYTMQQMCAYETVAIGYSKFCELFTQSEWEGFDYSLDLYFWYNSAFGSPVARVQGAGWIQEFLARLEHEPIESHRFSINSTLDDSEITFPLNQSLYVDATHEVVVLNIITALNLSTLAANGPLPYDHIPDNQSFKVSQLAPFATNIQFQILDCSSPSISSGQQLRVIVNDAPVPLTGIRGCPSQKDGMCPIDTFVKAQKEILDKTSWEWDCFGEYEDLVGVGEEWETVTGDAPRRV
ncbi:phosphoglycerate mutase-like protein [Lentinula aciculospora]|uniref:Phosphoglycerate mutase-like protein n=1 Tax=Lentinula aciculospora TaxID=153920 RepID=A0A9W9A342_9AGAR|nr:phosphoglycerate mutase-like protein [Lentinula aciculospora]